MQSDSPSYLKGWVFRPRCGCHLGRLARYDPAGRHDRDALDIPATGPGPRMKDGCQ
jgi:hypothetical protein